MKTLFAGFLCVVGLAGCDEQERAARNAPDAEPFGSYKGEVLLEDMGFLVSDVDDAFITVTFDENEGFLSAKGRLDGTIDTIINDVTFEGPDTMDVEDLEIDGLHLEGTLSEDDVDLHVEADFTPDLMTADLFIKKLGHVYVDLLEESE